ncbi:hypothetical protein GSI_04838 [Ganoderma sinense ZZ0214-1]|uniref:Uncharacterized protein n=1 Tax=Ganoderma sinense ZZ0214-1 TaxID=1077348 RepID=A0A2G8SG42_9APHY|nr:hypothetical protein GSI_04838 [Ganoderma sinense ZZ0214-1]
MTRKEPVQDACHVLRSHPTVADKRTHVQESHRLVFAIGGDFPIASYQLRHVQPWYSDPVQPRAPARQLHEPGHRRRPPEPERAGWPPPPCLDGEPLEVRPGGGEYAQVLVCDPYSAFVTEGDHERLETCEREERGEEIGKRGWGARVLVVGEPKADRLQPIWQRGADQG